MVVGDQEGSRCETPKSPPAKIESVCFMQNVKLESVKIGVHNYHVKTATTNGLDGIKKKGKKEKLVDRRCNSKGIGRRRKL